MKITKILFAFLCSLILSGFFIVSISAEEASTIFYDFNTEDELFDFSPYFVEHESGTDGQLEPFSNRFDWEKGTIISKKLSLGNGSTGNIAFLTISKYRFQNFEAELVFNFVGDSSWGWGGLSFRQENVGNGWRSDGCLAFVQKEGYASLWGSDRFDDTVYEGGKPTSFNKNTPFLLKVKVVNNYAEVSVSNLEQSVIYSSVSHNFSKQEANYSGYISIVSIDNTHAFHSLKITALDENGSPALLKQSHVPSEVSFLENETIIPVGTAHVLEIKVNPNNFPLSSLLWSSSDSEIAIVKGGSIIGIKPGTVTITVCSPFNLDLKDEIELTFTEEGGPRANTYSFNATTLTDYFTANYVRSENDPEAGNEDFSEHWNFKENSIIRTGLNPGAASDRDIASIYLDNRRYQNFEATLIYRNNDGEYGWVGLTSGVTSRSNRFIDDGQGFFVQREGIATIWGSKIGGPYEAAINRYALTEWHALKVRVVNKTISMYIDDLINPVFVKTVEEKPQAGEIAVFTSGRAEFEIMSLTVNYLDDAGNIIELEEMKKLEFAKKIETASVGDKINLEVVTEPVAFDDSIYTVSTSNGNICFYNNGILYFIGVGEVTITVECKLNKDLRDSMTITVSDDSPKNPIYYYPEQPAPPKPKGDTGKFFVYAIPGLLVAASIPIAWIRIKRKKQSSVEQKSGSDKK